MPASRFTKKVVQRPKLARQWTKVRDSAEARGLDAGTAIKMASGVVKRASARKRY